MKVTALLTRCRNKRPLIVLESNPFNGLEIRPEDLHDLAKELITIANLAERDCGQSNLKPVRVEHTSGVAAEEKK